MDDVIQNKVASMEKCLRRIHEEAQKDWMNNLTYQDALILNLERACQACIDAASNVVRREKWGIPKFSREVFDLLHEKSFISSTMADKLKRMVGFRNIAVHDYGAMSLPIVKNIIEEELDVFTDFRKVLLMYSAKGE